MASEHDASGNHGPDRDGATQDFAATPLGSALTLLAWILLLVGLGASGSIAFGPDDWYGGLSKPTFNPPSWIFGPVWTALYVLMAVALWLVRRDRTVEASVRRRATLLFVLQFVLNLAWTPLFFGLRSPGWRSSTSACCGSRCWRPCSPSGGCVRWPAICSCRTSCGYPSRWCSTAPSG